MFRWWPVRLVCYLAAMVATAAVARMLTGLLVPPSPSPLHGPLMMIRNLSLLVAAFVVYAVLVGLLERRVPREIDVFRAPAAFLGGGLVGTVLMGAVCLILWQAGVAHFGRGTGLLGLADAVVYPAVTALLEELLFRAVLFRIVEEVGGTAIAVVVSTILFGLAHAGNPGATPFAIVALSLELGVPLALAYALTRDIWLAAGIHAGWNFTQGYVFGASVSGAGQPFSLLKASFSGPDLFTGGSFGPEGSVAALGIGLMASAVLAVLVLRKGEAAAPRFRLRPQAS